jgi:hypothetical protein
VLEGRGPPRTHAVQRPDDQFPRARLDVDVGVGRESRLFEQWAGQPQALRISDPNNLRLHGSP